MSGSEAKSYPQRAFALPADAIQILLVRHGASAPAVAGTAFPQVDGHGDPPLAPIGEEQARKVGVRLAGEELAALFVTPLQRTVQTAAPLVAATGMAPVVVPELREVHLGDWEGGEFRIRMAEGDPIAMRVFDEQRWDVIPGAETAAAFAERTRAGVEAIRAAAGTGVSVAAFVHGAVIGELCRQATDSRALAFVHGENGSITRLLILGEGTWVLRSFNDTSHL